MKGRSGIGYSRVQTCLMHPSFRVSCVRAGLRQEGVVECNHVPVGGKGGRNGSYLPGLSSPQEADRREAHVCCGVWRGDVVGVWGRAGGRAVRRPGCGVGR